ncbi:TPA: anaerobic ribonucleoside-triphosphate reductase [Vibrio parahaemolyticus]
MNLQVVKKDGRFQDWDISKVLSAAEKSAKSIGVTLTEEQSAALSSSITAIARLHAIKGAIPVAHMHQLVIKVLSTINADLAAAYQNYRHYKEEWAQSWSEVTRGADRILEIGDRENANFDSTMTSTKSSLMRGELTKEIYKNRMLSPTQLSAIDDGFIYIHDLRDLIFNSINCCLFDMGNVLKGGFSMANLQYSEPKSALTALQVIGDVMLTATAQQFGGFTVPDIDKVMLPYVKKSLENLRRKGIRLGVKDLQGFIKEELTDELRQGFQSIEMKLNSVPSGRGDFAFTTFSFGNVDLESDEDRSLQILVCEAILSVRMKGTGKGQPVTFPKLVFLHNEAEMNKSKEYYSLFQKSIECTSKAMYPDYLSVDGDSYVGDMYRLSGQVISPMGCRAYLSKFENDHGETFFTGRANIGAVSLNLPMIWKKSEGERFYEDLEHYMQMIREFLVSRYEAIANNYCSSNPMAFTQGGLYKGNKRPEDKIGDDIVRSFTASFGVTALNELNVLMEGTPLHESDHVKVKEVLNFINSKIEEFKAEDGYLYALYGTPAESLCGTQVKQFRAKYGVIEGVSDREYFSNSFHMHVTADITPLEKQDLERDLFHLVIGGHIQYVRLTNTTNLQAIEMIVRRAMSMGFYAGVNFNLIICEDCGYRPENGSHDMDECPSCKSTNIMMINRLCGYVGYGKSKGQSRFNDSKLAEVQDRKSM